MVVNISSLSQHRTENTDVYRWNTLSDLPTLIDGIL